MTQNDLAHMSREELIELALELHAEVEALRMKLEKGKKPPTNSSNSSQPPSRDHKGNKPVERKKRQHGSPAGHAKKGREMVAQADRVIEIKPKECHICQTNLSQEPMVLKNINQITELPVAKAEVIEVRQYAADCPCCRREQIEEAPAGLEMGRSFGAWLEATVVYYRQEQHMSYARTEAALYNLNGVEISQGGIDKIMQRAAQKARQEVKPIAQTIQHSAVIYCDETSSRVDGQNWWHWVFCSMDAILHVVRFNRSVDVINDVMNGGRADAWVSDGWPPQLKAPAHQRQLCMAHQLRNLQAVVELYPQSSWASRTQFLFRYAIHLHHQRERLPTDEFFGKVQQVERVLNRLLQRPCEQPQIHKLQHRYQKYRDAIFLFLYRSDVSPTNNLSEQHLRPSVIHRKVTGGFRSGWGAQGYAALKSIIDTAALSGITPFFTIQNLCGYPSLPIPIGV